MLQAAVRTVPYPHLSATRSTLTKPQSAKLRVPPSGGVPPRFLRRITVSVLAKRLDISTLAHLAKMSAADMPLATISVPSPPPVNRRLPSPVRTNGVVSGNFPIGKQTSELAPAFSASSGASHPAPGTGTMVQGPSSPQVIWLRGGNLIRQSCTR